MITILATLGTFLMVFAVGSVEADNYMIGFILALLGVSSFVMTIMLQEKKMNQLNYTINNKEKTL
jgi:hypothetical protein